MRRLLVILALVATPPSAQARIIKIIIDKVESPAFTGQSLGNTGRYEKIIGRAIGEVDPLHPGNSVITNIQLVPKDPEAYVQYETQFYLLKPSDPSKSNGLLFYSAPNRGDKRGFTALNQGLSSSNDPTNPGDGFAMRRGYTMLWSGWQADVVPGGDRLGIKVPVAKNSQGGDITGLVRMEHIPTSATASGSATQPSYPNLPQKRVRLRNEDIPRNAQRKSSVPEERVSNGLHLRIHLHGERSACAWSRLRRYARSDFIL